METRYLGREDSPIAPGTWEYLDSCMISVARGQLAGRKVLEIEGPLGYGAKGIPLGDYELGAGVAESDYLPLKKLWEGFSLNMYDIAAFEEGSPYLDTGSVIAATRKVASLEDQAVFEGMSGCPGLENIEGSQSSSISKWEHVGNAAVQVIDAVTKLDEAGFPGPYSMALTPSLYNLLLRKYPHGESTELAHLKEIVTAGIVKAPAMKQGGILIATGRQYASLVLGQDMCIGYTGPSRDRLDFFITESLALLIREPGSIVVLKQSVSELG